MEDNMTMGEYWDIQMIHNKLWQLKEWLNEVIEEIRDCDRTDTATIKYLFNKKNNLMKEIDLYTNKLKWPL